MLASQRWSMPARSKGGGRGGTTSSSLISGVGGEGGDSLLMDYCSETVPSLTAGEFSMPPSGCSFMSTVKLWSMGNSTLLPCLIAEVGSVARFEGWLLTKWCNISSVGSTQGTQKHPRISGFIMGM